MNRIFQKLTIKFQFENLLFSKNLKKYENFENVFKNQNFQNFFKFSFLIKIHFLEIHLERKTFENIWLHFYEIKRKFGLFESF